jgi:Flp pilus assembly protein TadB
MSMTVIAVVLCVLLLAGGVVFALFGMNNSKAKGPSSNLRNMVMSQRDSRAEAVKQGAKVIRSGSNNLAVAAAAEGDVSKKNSNSSRIDLEKKLRYAKWPITAVQFRAFQVLAGIIAAAAVYNFATIWIFLMVLFMVPATIGGILDKAINKRFEAFDKDYPVLLLSYVSLLKTGMSAIQGLEAAAKGLDEDSLVREEVELLIERLRLGMTEEQAIGAFGEDIAHPELELFVQSLILSKRVGGTLSTTLERLAKQVRKRQQFRKQAVAAVGMERSSLHMIAVVMGLLMVYLTYTAPQLVFPAFKHPLGKKVFQFGIMTIVFGFYWSKKVTEIKI